MTDKHTLVERLEAWADSGDFGRGPDPTDLRRQAATRITALEAEVLQSTNNLLSMARQRNEANERITALEAREAELVEVLERSRQGWENVIELDLIPSAHRAEAQSLADYARATLAKHQEGEGNE